LKAELHGCQSARQYFGIAGDEITLVKLSELLASVLVETDDHADKFVEVWST
jgi:hypothetical protein